jgi:hypothetical protein
MSLITEINGTRIAATVTVPDETIQRDDVAVFLVRAWDDVASQLWKKLQDFKASLASNSEPPPQHTLD